MLNRQGYYVTDYERECTNCGAIYKRTSKTVTLCPACNSTRVKSNSIEYKMYQRAKQRARLYKREFSICIEDIKIPDVCPILGIPLGAVSGKSGGKANSPSLDRIDESKGYTVDNIHVISHKANMMKLDASKDELKKFAEWVFNYFGTD